MSDRPETFDAEEPPAPHSGPASESELVKLFREHNTSLVQLLRARLRSDQEARDVAQEAYVRLLQLDRIGTISYLRTYLFRTAINIATDRLRNIAMRESTHRDPIFDLGVDELSPDRAAVAADTLRVVSAALEALPPKPRYAFLLHRFADLEIEEVAARLGVTERMVRNYIMQALLGCRKALAEKGEDR